jgi:predicted phage-related endonuclease
VTDIPPARILDAPPSIAVHVDQQRDESCLGASEAAGVLGLDKYNPPIKVWRRHRGLDVDDRRPGHVQEAAEWGQILEPVIRGKYAVRNQATVLVPVKSYVRDGWLRCTPDGMVMDVTHTVGVSEVDTWPIGGCGSTRLAGLVQCKNVSAYLDHEWRDGPPTAKEIQVRTEMAVTGLPWCDLAALIGGNHYIQYRVERDLGLEDRILTDLAAFWTLVKIGVEPTVDHTDAWRMHIAEKMPAEKMIGPATESDVDAMLQLRRRREDRKAAKALEDLARNELLLRMSARGVTALQSLDTKIGTVSAYKAKGTWALRCPRNWGDDDQPH